MAAHFSELTVGVCAACCGIIERYSCVLSRKFFWCLPMNRDGFRGFSVHHVTVFSRHVSAKVF